MNSPIISKSLILSHRQCPKRAWLEAHGNVEADHSMGQRALLDQGHSVHEAGRSLFPQALRIPAHLGLTEAAAATALALSAGTQELIEACFVGGRVGVRLDILRVDAAGGLHIIEIKSGGEVKDAYLDDAAIQYSCAVESGASVQSVQIMYPSSGRAREYGTSGGEVMVSENVTDSVHWRSKVVPIWVAECVRTLEGDEPNVEPGHQCCEPNECPFAAHCGKPVENTDPDLIEYLPSKAGDIKKFVQDGMTRISELPALAFTNARNALVREAVLHRRAVVVQGIAEQIRDLPYPRHYVDFEAASFALPLHPGMRAHQPLVFQWSVHTELDAESNAVHREFLDTTGGDPREEFARCLLRAVGASGPVLVFSAYEKTRLKELAVLLPDLKDALMGVIERIVDLLPLARRGYYHPDMRGSWSLKRISPTLPKLAGVDEYEELEDVADGMAAQAAYAQMIDPKVIGVDKVGLRSKMLRYCATDTAGLMRFVHYMQAALPAVASQPQTLELQAA